MPDLPPFSEVLAAARAEGDLTPEQLADLIDEDGRSRIDAGTSVCLQMYIDAIPNLSYLSDPLDAAIDVTLHARSGSSKINAHAVQSLIRDYPQFASQIAESAALSCSILSTNSLNEKIANAPSRTLPADFGPLMDDGHLRYQLVERFDDGSSGDVYKAIDRKLCEPDEPVFVAIKILPPADAPARKHVAREEAVKARQISDENVVGVLDYGITDEGERYIVHVYIAGGNLRSWMNNNPMPRDVKKVVSLTTQIARGVQAAHEVGLIHCDIKPSNIMLTVDEQPKVADFGIAVRTRDGRRHSTAKSDRVPIGNLAYISPEQFHLAGDMPLTVRSDVYSIGGMLYDLLTGVLPHGETPNEIATAHERPLASRTAPSPRKLCKTIDRDLDGICRRALAPEPARRYRSAGALADDLDKWLSHRPIDWQRPSVFRKAKLLAIRQPIAMIAAAGLLVVSILGGYFAYRAVEESARRQAMIDNAQGIVQRLADVNEDQPPTSRLPRSAWILRHVLESELIGLPIDTADVQLTNMRNLEKFLSERESRGQPLGLFDQLCKYTLAFWMLGEGQAAGASALLDELQLFADSHLPANDDFHDDLAAMSAVAQLQLLLRDEQPEHDADALTDIEQTLQRVAQSRGQSDPGSPLHLFLLDSLQALYEESSLRNAEALQILKARMEEATSRRLLFGN